MKPQHPSSSQLERARGEASSWPRRTFSCPLEAARNRLSTLCDGNPFIALELAAHEGGREAPTPRPFDKALHGSHRRATGRGSYYALHVAAVLGQYAAARGPGERHREHGLRRRQNPAAAHRSGGCWSRGAERYDFRHAIVREHVVPGFRQRAAGRASCRSAGGSAVLQPGRLAGRPCPLGAPPRGCWRLPRRRSPWSFRPQTSTRTASMRFPEARRHLCVAQGGCLWHRVDDPQSLGRVVIQRPGVSRGRDGAVGRAVHPTRQSFIRKAYRDGARRRESTSLGWSSSSSEALWAAGHPAAALAAWERSEGGDEGGPPS